MENEAVSITFDNTLADHLAAERLFKSESDRERFRSLVAECIAARKSPEA